MNESPRLFVRLFKPQFAPLVEQRIKRQTVRPTPKRMPRPGDRISLRAWTGLPYRTPQRVLLESIVTGVSDITLEPTRLWLNERLITKHPRRSSGEQTLDSFAMADGFESWSAMAAWFEREHGLPFNGILIEWA
jgi:hypothetical protein